MLDAKAEKDNGNTSATIQMSQTSNDTLVYLVDQSPRGLRARDLKQIVKLEVLNVLNRLTKAGPCSEPKSVTIMSTFRRMRIGKGYNGIVLPPHSLSRMLPLWGRCGGFVEPSMKSNGGYLLDWRCFVRTVEGTGKSRIYWGCLVQQ